MHALYVMRKWAYGRRGLAALRAARDVALADRRRRWCGRCSYGRSGFVAREGDRRESGSEEEAGERQHATGRLKTRVKSLGAGSWAVAGDWGTRSSTAALIYWETSAKVSVLNFMALFLPMSADLT